MDVYLEVGAKRVFAGALAWPGWCRAGRDEAGALEALLAYGPRYAGAIRGAGVRPAFSPPKKLAQLSVVERVKGDATTDFGAPSIAPKVDAEPMRPADVARLSAILDGCWGALDGAAAGARGIQLAKGPRGGGRDLDTILSHVADAEAAYGRRIGVRPSGGDRRAALLAGIASAASGGLPAAGPRGGKMWSPRYFLRRDAWHILDHTWEIEDRSG